MSDEKKRVAIVGFTDSRHDLPKDDPNLEVWGCNNLHLYHEARWTRWFDLHDIDQVRKDTQHVSWLKTTQVPVYMWEAQDEYPTSQAYPRKQITSIFGKYFTNSISWMIALAIAENFEWIGVYGVDMAQDTEYAAQRPSCEYFLGLAVGRGIEVYIPRTSDLLKSSAMYGAESDSALRAKLDAHEAGLVAKLNEASAARDNAQAVVLQVQGALETVRYVKGVWTMPEIQRDGQESSTAQVSGILQAVPEVADAPA